MREHILAETKRVQPVARPADIKYIFVDADGNRAGEVGRRKGRFYFQGRAGAALLGLLRVLEK